MTVHIWYSGATDTTGKALAEALHASSGATKPRSLRAGDVVIGWGTKTEESVTFPTGVLAWNAPDKIKINRDKVAALHALKGPANTRQSIAPFVIASGALSAITGGTISLPVVGRKKHHQGGAGFWFCPTRQHVDAAISEGAEYFQQFINIKDEYRLHIGFGSVFHAVKKEKNPSEESYRTIRIEKLKEWADKEEVDITDAKTDRIIKHLCHIFYKEETLPNMLIRSNRRGWKFDAVALNRLPTDMQTTAVHAIENLGLQFGAVDCCIDHNNKVYILEVNTGPGLQGTALTKWVEMFSRKIADTQAAARRTEHPAPISRPTTGSVRPARSIGAVGAAEADDIDDGLAVRMVKAAETDEDIRNVLRMLRKQGQ